MLTVRLDPELEKRLDALAKATRRSKSHYVKAALEDYLADNEARLSALAALEGPKRPLDIETLRGLIEEGLKSPIAKDFSIKKLNAEMDRKHARRG